MDAYGGNDEESAELRKLLAEVNDDPDNFEIWEKLVRAGESLEGGINRNSSSQAITTIRSIYDRLLAKFPLFFGYWKKYADMEFAIAGTEAAEMVYERGVASITNSVDLWTNYCAFKSETCHDADVIRELFERGAVYVGLDFLAHPFWDKYIEFEERLESFDRIFAILARIISIPMHQYARYFEKYRQMAQTRPLTAIVPPGTLTQLQMDLENEGLGYKAGLSQTEVERELRVRIDAYHLELFRVTQTETTKRWTYEAEIKRPYFHVTDLDEAQLANWRKYLDFEESEGDYTRIQFLYERCLVTCAQYEEFWLRYARWMLGQPGKEEEVRNIYQRAACIFVPIALPTVRLQYAYFEEMTGRVDVAKDIHEAILVQLPGHVETIVSLANTTRRHSGLDAAVAVYQSHIDAPTIDISAKAALVAEWAGLLWKVKGAPEEARQVFQKNQHWYLDSPAFWTNYLRFEIEQPTTADTEQAHHDRIRSMVDEILTKSRLGESTVQQLVTTYMKYLLEKGTKDAAKEYMTLDREINGPISVQKLPKALTDPSKGIVGAVNGQPPPIRYA
ncbi:Pre-mRNA-processing factor 39 [Exophiala dermatitidis]